jgi:cell division protein ZapE
MEPDRAQQHAVGALDELHAALSAKSNQNAESTLEGWARRLFHRRKGVAAIRGLYLWGGVGRGKTRLMDLFYDTLPEDGKRRVHFHRFMQKLHGELREAAGQRNPLERIGSRLARQARVLCLDEMQVEDIADAMLMGGLLESLFRHGVTLVTTSNMPPAGLYRAGLQRDRFLPAIGLIEQHCRVLELDSPVDYRLRQLAQAGVYIVPTGPEADAALARHFSALSGGAEGSHTPVSVNGRPIPVICGAAGVVWLDFDIICNIPRSKSDYVELARGFHTVLLSNLRRLDDDQSDRVHRLVTLIDALYDRACKLVCSADGPPDELYVGRDLAHAFERTASRLVEMQTEHYLASDHLA